MWLHLNIPQFSLPWVSGHCVQTAIKKTLNFSAKPQYTCISFFLSSLCCRSTGCQPLFFQDKTSFVAERTVKIWWYLAQLLCPADSQHKARCWREKGGRFPLRCQTHNFLSQTWAALRAPELLLTTDLGTLTNITVPNLKIFSSSSTAWTKAAKRDDE